jgi:hypothetical protein
MLMLLLASRRVYNVGPTHANYLISGMYLVLVF